MPEFVTELLLQFFQGSRNGRRGQIGELQRFWPFLPRRRAAKAQTQLVTDDHRRVKSTSRESGAENRFNRVGQSASTDSSLKDVASLTTAVTLPRRPLQRRVWRSEDVRREARLERPTAKASVADRVMAENTEHSFVCRVTTEVNMQRRRDPVVGSSSQLSLASRLATNSLENRIADRLEILVVKAGADGRRSESFTQLVEVDRREFILSHEVAELNDVVDEALQGRYRAENLPEAGAQD